MIKIHPAKFEKIWGYELYLYSALPGRQSVDEKGKKVTNGPFVKIVRANERLSVQVHPDDTMAKKLENEPNGKNESWYVLQTFRKNPRLVVGLADYDERKIKQMLTDGTFEKNLLTVQVQVGDFINIPAGLVHGLGAGIEVLEVQQVSDTTYRYYDYNRQENGKPRPLHLEKALQCQKKLSHKLEPTRLNPLTYVNEVCEQVFHKKPIRLEKDAVVVNLENYDCFAALAGEKVPFENFVAIHQRGWKH